MGKMDKEKAIMAQNIVDSHIHELTLQLDICTMDNEEYKDVVHTLMELNTLKALQMNIRVTEGYFDDAGE